MEKTVSRFLARVHDTKHACGLVELARNAGVTPKAVQTWQHIFGDALTYFPNTECSAFDLLHLHIFLTQPSGRWEEWPYAIRTLHVVQQPRDGMLYLHCLVPRVHEQQARDLLDTLQQEGYCTGVRIITTRDGWQGVTSSNARVVWRQQSQSAWDVVEYYPLIIPVVCEMIERRPNIPAVWTAIYDRLGESVWEYLPAGVRPLRHNGKCYVREALRLLNERFLVNQHIVRFAPSDYDRINLVAIIRAPASSIITLLGQDATNFEIFPINEGEQLVLTNTNLSLLRRLLPIGTGIARLPVRFYSPILFTFGVQPIKNQTITDAEVHEQWSRTQPVPAAARDPPIASTIAVSEREEALLRDVATTPISPITHRYQRLGWHVEVGNRTKDAIITKGLARFDAVTTLKGIVKILTLTPKANAWLTAHGVELKQSRAGGAEHEFWKHEVRTILEQHGYIVHEEYALGAGKTADLRAERNGQVRFIEIETGRSDIPANLAKYKERDDLVVCFTNEDVAARYRDLVQLDRPGTRCLTPRDLEQVAA